MSGVRVLVGTRKGAFVLTSDGTRKQWDVSGPHFAGWEIYHLKGSPVDPNRIYASQSSGWFGQMIQRSTDGGRTWTAATTGIPEGSFANVVREAGLPFQIVRRQVHEHADTPHPLALLCACNKRPCRRSTAEKRDELASF